MIIYATTGKKLLEIETLRGADLQGADLQGADLHGADLRWAYLRGADLRGADLQGANLCKANLCKADLRWAYSRGADLQGANLRGADLRGVDLRGADLQGADLQGADLRGAVGNSKEIQTVQTKLWPIVLTNHFMQIGCEQHSYSDWFGFSDERIHEMSSKALAWWKVWKPIIMQIIKESF